MSKARSESFESLIGDISWAALASNHLQLKLNGSVVEINSNSKAFLNRLAYMYPTNEPSIARPDISLTVLDEPLSNQTQVLGERFIELSSKRTLQKLNSGMVFLRGKKTNLVKGPASANVEEVVQFIERLLDKSS